MLASCRRLAWVGLLAVSSGCAMCQNCDDEAYAAYGGAWERNDRCYGRVGSAFTPEVGTRVVPDGMIESVTEEESSQAADPAEPRRMEDEAPQPPPDAPGKAAGNSILRRPIRSSSAPSPVYE